MNVVTALAGDMDFTRTRFLVAESKPLFRGVARTALSPAMSRAWTLQSTEHDLKVPAVDGSAGDVPNVSVSGKEIWRRDVGAQDGARPQTTESPAPKPLSATAEFQNERRT